MVLVEAVVVAANCCWACWSWWKGCSCSGCGGGASAMVGGWVCVIWPSLLLLLLFFGWGVVDYGTGSGVFGFALFGLMRESPEK